MKLNSIFLIMITIIWVITGCARRTPHSPSEQEGLVLISETQTPGWALDLVVHNDTLYLADDNSGVELWDISNLEAPVIINNINTVTSAKGLAYLSLNRLIIIIESGSNTLYKIDSLSSDSLSDVMSLSETGDRYIEAFDIEIDTALIIISESGAEGLRIYWTWREPTWDDFWNPWHEENIGGSYKGFHTDLSEKIIYAAKGQHGLEIIEFTYEGVIGFNILGTVDTYSNAKDVTVNASKTLAFVADDAGGIQIFNVSDKAHPVWVSELKIRNVENVELVVLVGDTLYFTDRFDGLFAVDISNPEEPLLLGEYDTPAPKGFFVSENHTVFLADQDLGLLILKWR